jgi:hypothetical protein
MKIELNKQKEQEPLLELQTSDGYIDLHNDYNVEKISYENCCLQIYLLKSFPSASYTPRSKPQSLKLSFFDCTIIGGGIGSLRNENAKSIDNLSRSSNHTNKWFYTFSFIDGEEYEIECGEAFLESIG